MPFLCGRTSLTVALLLTALISARAADAPQPLLAKGGPAVDWWFVFKFGASKPFAGCGPVSGDRKCPFGGTPLSGQSFGQQFAVASSANPDMKAGQGCLGAQLSDPVGATFDQVYNGNFFYVLWNDQFYGDPKVCGSSANCTGSWGHSKGLLAWNDDGNGFIMQVSTPSWPGSGSARIKRKIGNTLGCVSSNNNLKASQHFFALKLTKDDLLKVLEAMRRANVATDPKVSQVVANGGPPDVRAAVLKLGQKPSKSDKFAVMHETLSTMVHGKPVELIGKPSNLHVPPWQLVSALLGGVSARAATWWTAPKIATTTKSSKVKCWDASLKQQAPGAVDIAMTGDWKDSSITLYAPSNHAKIGTGESSNAHYAIFGDLNQQGSLSPPPDCGSSQNGRGGMFFVLQDPTLFDSMKDLIHGDTAPTAKN
ncbi:MAG: deoxyribonuclease II family protein [Pseudolabrys sp.]